METTVTDLLRRLSRACIAVLCLGTLACGGNDSTGPSAAKVPNYAGNWSGTYTLTGCNQNGTIAAANLCGSLGTTSPYTFNLTQSSTNVSGSFALGTIQFQNVGGTVKSDGSLALQGTSVSNGITIVVNWALNIPASALSGTVTQQWTSTGLSGSATVAGSINSAIRAQNSSAFVTAPALLSGGLREVIGAVAGE